MKQPIYSNARVVGGLCLVLVAILGMSARRDDISHHRFLTLIDESVTLEPLFPLQAKDYWGFFFAVLGLVVAAGGK